jgi:TRAP-type C4-dicarboxylate transport system permease small subunit
LSLVIDRLRFGLDIAAAVLLLCVLAVTSTQVTVRYVFGMSMPWGEELTRLLFVWLVLVAAASARHMRVDLMPDALAPVPRRILRVANATISAMLLAVLIYYSLGLIELTANDRYTALGLSVQYLYWSVVVGGTLWLVLGLAEAVTDRQESPSAPS